MPPHAKAEAEEVAIVSSSGRAETKKDGSGLITRDYLIDRSAKDNWSAMDHILWTNVFWFTLLHAGAIYGLYVALTQAKMVTILWAVLVYHLSLFGVTAGVHRLWSHRAYKAAFPFRVILAFLNSMSYQNSVYEWARDHRVHHKYSETNADPVNIERGFFFAHVGWLLSKKHPDVKEYGGKVDLSDIMADPVTFYQHKYYVPSVVLMCFFLPTWIPMHFWGESFLVSFFVPTILRYCLALNSTWFVNSAAHMFGNRPYDVNIAPAENKTVSILTLGEGFHNYHHTFPWDYSTSEWGYSLNITTVILDALAKIGWVFDRRSASKDMIKSRQSRTGPKAKATGKYEKCELNYW